MSISFLEALRAEGDRLISLVSDNLALSQSQIQEWLVSQTDLTELRWNTFAFCLFVFGVIFSLLAIRSYRKIKVNELREYKKANIFSALGVVAFYICFIFGSIQTEYIFNATVKRSEVANPTLTISKAEGKEGLEVALEQEVKIVRERIKEHFNLYHVPDEQKPEISYLSANDQTLSPVSLAWHFCQYVAPKIKKDGVVSMDLPTCLAEEIDFEMQIVDLLYQVPRENWKYLNQSRQDFELAVILDLQNFILNRLYNEKHSSLSYLHNQALNFFKLQKEFALPVLAQADEAKGKIENIYQEFKTKQEKLFFVGQDQKDFAYAYLGKSFFDKDGYIIRSDVPSYIAVPVSILFLLFLIAIDFLLKAKLKAVSKKALETSPELVIDKNYQKESKFSWLESVVMVIFAVGALFLLSNLLFLKEALLETRTLPPIGNERLTQILKQSNYPTNAYVYFKQMEKALNVDFVQKYSDRKENQNELEQVLFKKLFDVCYSETLTVTEKEEKYFDSVKSNACIENRLAYYQSIVDYVETNEKVEAFIKQQQYVSVVDMLERQNVIGFGELEKQQKALDLLKTKVSQMSK